MERSGSDNSAKITVQFGLLGWDLTWVLDAQGRSSVVVVEHVGGQRSLDLVAVCVSHHLLFCFLFLFLFRSTL